MGTLLRENGTLIGRGSIQARLYIINDPDDPGQNFYPGALPSPRAADRVYGEIYEVHAPDDVFDAFDAYEACSPDWPEPHEFLRRKVMVRLDDGTYREAISYLYSWDISEAEHVPSGRFHQIAPNVR